MSAETRPGCREVTGKILTRLCEAAKGVAWTIARQPNVFDLRGSQKYLTAGGQINNPTVEAGLSHPVEQE